MHNPSCPIYAFVAAIATPAQAAIALAHRQPPCQGATITTASTVAPTSGRAGHGWQPLAGTLQSVAKRHPYGLLPSRAALASLAGYCPCERRQPPLRAVPGRSRSPPCRGPWPRPGRGWPIWMVKMKEVKRSPLWRYPHGGSLQRNSSKLISQLLHRGRDENTRCWLKL
ncbi:hypothetical protein B296_00047710 [Ensete ventricosum]|uniref:Secreted protein n=1 Tax=Ensete ventricosum TaxID=4639 RepID=A0A426X3D0_ENSVE|nr:hypothetical protein B296_00047710 [Ensete ventricosum]